MTSEAKVHELKDRQKQESLAEVLITDEKG
jgi:hypothetical protein